MSGPRKGTTKYHACDEYGHETQIPDYRGDISIPRTLQGHYAKNGGCPCQPQHTCGQVKHSCATATSTPSCAAAGEGTYRASPGPHRTRPAVGNDEPRDPATGLRTCFPNASNYGGTVSQRGPTTLTTTAQLRDQQSRRTEKKEERLQDRKNLLKAVLRDEILSRIDAEAQRDSLEADQGLMGANHAVEHEQMNGPNSFAESDGTRRTGNDRGIYNVPTVGEQYSEVMDELRYVAGQPVGSKLNVIRLHYLLEEQERFHKLRTVDRTRRDTRGSGRI